MGRYRARGAFATLALASTVFVAVLLAGTFGMAPMGNLTVGTGGTGLVAPSYQRLDVDVAPDETTRADREGRGPGGDRAAQDGRGATTAEVPGLPRAPGLPGPAAPPQEPSDSGNRPGPGPGRGPGAGSGPGPAPGPQPGPPGPGPAPPGPGEPAPPGPGEPAPPAPVPPPRAGTGVPAPSAPDAPVVVPQTPDEDTHKVKVKKKQPRKGGVAKPGKPTRPAKQAKPAKAANPAKPAKVNKAVTSPAKPAKSAKAARPHHAQGPKAKGPVRIVTPPTPAKSNGDGPKYRPPEPAQQTHPTKPQKWSDAQPHPVHSDEPGKAHAASAPPVSAAPPASDNSHNGNGKGKGRSKNPVPPAAGPPPAVDTGNAAAGNKAKKDKGPGQK